MSKNVIVASLFVWMLLACGGSVSRNAFHESTWRGAWNRADAERVALDFAIASQAQNWAGNAAVFTLGSVADANLRTELGKAFAVVAVPNPQALRLDAVLSQVSAKPLVLQVELNVVDPTGAVLWTAERRVQKEERANVE